MTVDHLVLMENLEIKDLKVSKDYLVPWDLPEHEDKLVNLVKMEM